VGEPQDRDFLLSIFLLEAWDTVAALEEGAARLRAAGQSAPPLDPADLDDLILVTHRLKGAAGLNGFPGLGELAGAAETVLEELAGAPPGARAAGARRIADFAGDLVGVLKPILDGIGAAGREPAAEIAAFRARHPAAFAGAAPAPPPGNGRDAPLPRSGPASDVEAAPSGDLRAEMARFFVENAEILTYFGPEGAEHLETMARALGALERGETEELATLLRAVHTLKGAAYTVGYAAMGRLAHRIEDLLGAPQQELALAPPVLESLWAALDVLRHLLAGPDLAPADLPAALERAEARLVALMPAAEPAAAAPGARDAAPPGPDATVAAPAAAERAPATRDAVRPSIRVGLDRLDALLDLVGELVVARSRLDQRFARLERLDELLGWSRARMTHVVRDFERKHLDPQLPGAAARRDGAPATGGDVGPGRLESVSELFAELEFDRYDDFNILARSVGEISADLSEVQAQLAVLFRQMRDDATHLQRLTGALRREATRARMVPIGRLFARFPRQVREVAQAAGKDVRLQLVGEAVELDNAIVEQIADPLLHALQNAVVHGIEPTAERVALGKASPGTIVLGAYHRGGWIEVEVQDDGRGIDPAVVRAQAIRQGFVDPDVGAGLSDREVLELIFRPGFTTAGQVTPVAGRGIGMDVVRTNVGRLHGEVEIDTVPGTGTRLTLRVPLTVVISESLMVRAGRETFAIPLHAVRVVRTARPEAVERTGDTEMVRIGDEALPLVRLDRALGLLAGAGAGPLPVLVVRAAGQPFALAVDAVLDKEEIVVRPLGGYVERLGPYGGATVTGEGRVVLVLDPARLQLPSGGGAAAAATPAPAEAPRLPVPEALRILLVDDSVSVRRFVGQMLERAGFRVSTANDGAEALARLGDQAVDLVITDLEMPRVNGYELIEELRRRSATRDLPVVVLTTRTGAKHLALARRLGVEHYVPKPVDERAFVRLVAGLAAAARPAALAGLDG
jgi:chemosensory pili system protein ChpA (sensor histidine kinase/response regulator)